jgi:hypothetical protein
MLDPLSRRLDGAAPERIAAFTKFRAGLGANAPWSDVRAAAVEGQLPEPERLFEYLTLRGPSMLPLAADIYEEAKGQDLRKLVLGYFEKMAKTDPLTLAQQARTSGPEAAKAILGVLSEIRDPRTIPLLEDLLSCEDKSVRLKAIRALGAIQDDAARRILVRLLHDPDREVRIQAASCVRLGGDPEKVRELIGLIADKSFLRKSEAEASALLLALGHCGTEEAGLALAALLKKRSLFGKARLRAAQLGAVRALKVHGGPAAAEALAACARRGPRALRSACREAPGRPEPEESRREAR